MSSMEECLRKNHLRPLRRMYEARSTRRSVGCSRSTYQLKLEVYQPIQPNVDRSEINPTQALSRTD
jgi:hypothetical protein